MAKKTHKGWDKSGLDLDKYLNPLDQIDWEIYAHIIECVAAHFSAPGFGQNGEAMYEKGGIIYRDTVMQLNDKYYYLGVLPEFKND